MYIYLTFWVTYTYLSRQQDKIRRWYSNEISDDDDDDDDKSKGR